MATFGMTTPDKMTVFPTEAAALEVMPTVGDLATYGQGAFASTMWSGKGKGWVIALFTPTGHIGFWGEHNA